METRPRDGILSNSRGLEILALMDHKQGFEKCPRGEFSSFSSHD